MLPSHIYKKSDAGDFLYYTWFSAMHTRIDLVFIGSETESFFSDATSAIQERISAIEHCANCFDPHSELSEVNRSAYEHPVELSPDLFQILGLCIENNRKSLGLFDITTDSKNFSSDTIHNINLSSDLQISFSKPNIYLNLSGFLKGYALESVRPILSNRGIENALLNMGNSSILAIGNQHANDGWNVQIRNNHDNIVLKDACLTTSGNDTELRKHIVHPFTGELISGERTISVITKDGVDGEVLSTALFLATQSQKELLFQNFQIEQEISLP